MLSVLEPCTSPRYLQPFTIFMSASTTFEGGGESFGRQPASVLSATVVRRNRKKGAEILCCNSPHIFFSPWSYVSLQTPRAPGGFNLHHSGRIPLNGGVKTLRFQLVATIQRRSTKQTTKELASQGKLVSRETHGIEIFTLTLQKMSSGNASECVKCGQPRFSGFILLMDKPASG